MENIFVKVDGCKLILEIDLDHVGPFTNRGRSRRIASSKGNVTVWADGQPLPDGVRFNVNVYRRLRENELAEAAEQRRRL